MGFVRCNECRNLISTKALFCPGCGAPNKDGHMLLVTVEPDQSSATNNSHQMGFNIHCLLSRSLVQRLGLKVFGAECRDENVFPDDQERMASVDNRLPKTVFEYIGNGFTDQKK